MSVRGKFQIDGSQIADMSLSITVTMNVSEWKTFRENLWKHSSWPANDVGRVVDEALKRIDAVTSQTFRDPKDDSNG